MLSSLAIPLELILIVGVAIDLLLAYLGFNVFKSIRKRLRARKPTRSRMPVSSSKQ